MLKKYYKFFVFISLIFIFLSIAGTFYFGIVLGPSFTGGTSVIFSYDTKIQQNIIKEKIPFDIVQLREVGDKYSIKVEILSEDEKSKLLDFLSLIAPGYQTHSYATYGPSLSNELFRKSIVALILASIIIIAFVSYVFSSVSKPVSSWKYGCIAVVALFHDIVIPIGIFSLLSGYGAQVDILFVMALLAIIGYSINDTLVIFDRIREALRTNKNTKNTFEDLVEKGVKSSIRRSIFTSFTTAVPLFLLFIFVPVVQWFALTLFIGVIVGTYSSIFFAPSLLIIVNKVFSGSSKDKEKKSLLHTAEDELLERLKNDEN